MNAILDLQQPIVSVVFLNPFSFKDFEDDKLVCVDVKATDQVGRVFIVEVQIVVHPSFSKRAVYYACKGYSDQLHAGQGYSQLKATYSVCLLRRKLWDDDCLHHHFQLVERSSGKVLEESIEIHTVELSKYNGSVETVTRSSELEQWCYWLKNSGEHTEEELRQLLPGLAFLRATQELSDIQQITEEKELYDSREKAALDYESGLIDAQQEGLEKGLEKGLETGEAIGRVKTYQELLEDQVASNEDLSKMTQEQLMSTIATLQSRLRERKT